ncbi:hypothetical protein [Pseudomonas savastanoi]|uniref:hypothetical protein n=1 Tax=Pseudomonas savastanoi TaxID=29438 RepID=UPI000EFDE615|nr:hypothetical protein [Pseudomonas savastanoi]RMQ63392.1 hypothetical protein ALQ01_200059 [Pseudomonas savastanoi pv. glycinea]
METPDRSLYDIFQADQRTQSLRALRSTLETRIDEHFSVVRLLASADEQLSFESLHVTTCNRNDLDLQSSSFSTGIDCVYSSQQTGIICE